MPYAFLTDTSLDPVFGPLVPSDNVNDTDYDYLVFETLLQIGRSEKACFESVFVLEGLRGLFVTPSDAKSLGISDGQTVDCFVGTYQTPQIFFPGMPTKHFWMQLTVHIWPDEAISPLPLKRAQTNPHPIAIGLCDILAFFDILLGDRVIAADERGNLDVWSKKEIDDTDWILVKKSNVTRRCETVPF